MPKVTGPRSYLKHGTINYTTVGEMSSLIPGSNSYLKAEVVSGQDNFSTKWVFKPVVNSISNGMSLSGITGEYYTDFNEAREVSLEMMKEFSQKLLDEYNDMKNILSKKEEE